MKKLELVANECINEVINCGIEPQKITTWKVNTKANSRWGQCKRTGNGIYSIEVSDKLLDDNVPIKSLKQTLIHEILHTCKNCMNHKETWKNYANKINKKYGYNIKRANNADELGS